MKKICDSVPVIKSSARRRFTCRSRLFGYFLDLPTDVVAEGKFLKRHVALEVFHTRILPEDPSLPLAL